MFNWKVVILILVLLTIADKAITVANLNAIKKNFPDIDPLKAEKNPIARFFFQKCGLIWGTIIYGVIGLLTALLFMLVLNLMLSTVGVPNSLSISFYVVMIIYGITITNNLYFFLKYSRIIP